MQISCRNINTNYHKHNETTSQKHRKNGSGYGVIPVSQTSYLQTMPTSKFQESENGHTKQSDSKYNFAHQSITQINSNTSLISQRFVATTGEQHKIKKQSNSKYKYRFKSSARSIKLDLSTFSKELIQPINKKLNFNNQSGTARAS